MGSDSDMPVMSKAADILEKLGIDYEMRIISAHREPDVFFDYAKTAEEKGFKVIIAGIPNCPCPSAKVVMSVFPSSSIDRWSVRWIFYLMPHRGRFSKNNEKRKQRTAVFTVLLVVYHHFRKKYTYF